VMIEDDRQFAEFARAVCRADAVGKQPRMT
jgi:hypothetical protein